jgi:hypothetical protein
MTLSKTDELIMEIAKETDWNKREIEFIKPSEKYLEFCAKYRYIKNTIGSYKAFDEECAIWRRLAMKIILEDRVEFNATH